MIIKRTKNVSGVYSKEKASTVNNELKPLREEYLKLLSEDGLVWQKK